MKDILPTQSGNFCRLEKDKKQKKYGNSQIYFLSADKKQFLLNITITFHLIIVVVIFMILYSFKYVMQLINYFNR